MTGSERSTPEELLHVLEHLRQGAVSLEHPASSENLIRMLALHQVELERQNKQLRETQVSLEESRSGYADLFDFAPVALCSLDDKALVTELNLGCSRLFGVSRPAALGKPLVSLVRIADVTRFWSHLARARRELSRATTELELEIDGAATFVEVVSVPILSAGRSVIGFRTAMTDITPRMQLELRTREAHEAERRLRMRFEALDQASFSISCALTSSTHFDASDALDVIAEQARLVAAADSVDIHVERLLAHVADGRAAHDADGERHVVPLRFLGRQLGEMTVRRSRGLMPLGAGERRTLELLADRAATALEIARIARERDREAQELAILDRIGQRIAGLESRRDTVAALQDVVTLAVPGLAAAMSIYIADADGDLERVAVHPPLSSADADAPRKPGPGAAIRRLMLEARPVRAASLAELLGVEGELGRAGGVLAFPIVARDRTLGVLCFVSDATTPPGDELERRAEDIALRCAFALDTGSLLDELRAAVAAREHVLAAVSHDLRSPLNAISLSASVLSDVAGGTEQRRTRKQVDLIKRSASRMSHLVGDLVLSRNLETGTLTVDLKPEQSATLLSEACELGEASALAKGLTLRRVHGGPLPAVWADRERILQVFSNLLGNAIKFTPAPGTILLGGQQRGAWVEFSVSDTGPGIASSDLGRIFDAYWTAPRTSEQTKRSGAGLGLGLNIAKGIVEAHGGEVRVESKEGEGATFYFTLRVPSD